MVLVASKFSRIAWSTSLVASVQMSMSSMLRSCSEMRPRSRFSWIWAFFSSYFAMISALFGGGTTSDSANDAPERVDHERSEEHTSELQSRFDLVCRLLLGKKNKDAHQ